MAPNVYRAYSVNSVSLGSIRVVVHTSFPATSLSVPLAITFSPSILRMSSVFLVFIYLFFFEPVHPHFDAFT